MKPFDSIMPNTYVIHAEDHVIPRGLTGFFTNSTKFASFDHYHIKPLKCIIEEEL